MSNSRSLLPPNASALERAFEITSDRLRAPAVHTLWDPWECPLRLLPWLAYAVAVGEWSDDWSEQTKRQTIASAAGIARRRGTVWAVREALRAAGYADAEVEEGLPVLRHDGTQLRDGYETYGSGNRWAMFRLLVDLGEEKGVGGAEQARLLRLIDAAKPARSQLREIVYRAGVTDTVDIDEDQRTTVEPCFTDVRPAGRRRDGSLSRDNAIRLDPEPTQRNSQWARDGEIQRIGLSPYAGWEIIGETRANDWDRQQTDISATVSEQAVVIDPRRTGAAHRDGAFVRGEGLPSAYDDGTLSVHPRLADTIAVEEQHHTTVEPCFTDMRPAGRRRDGSLSRDNAIRLDPEPTQRNSQWARDGEIQRIGLSPYAGWEITGETRANDWEGFGITANSQVAERAEARRPTRNGLPRRDGAQSRGASMPSAFDAATLQIRIRQRRNARIARNGSIRHVAVAASTLTL